MSHFFHKHFFKTLHFTLVSVPESSPRYLYTKYRDQEQPNTDSVFVFIVFIFLIISLSVIHRIMTVSRIKDFRRF